MSIREELFFPPNILPAFLSMEPRAKLSLRLIVLLFLSIFSRMFFYFNGPFPGMDLPSIGVDSFGPQVSNQRVLRPLFFYQGFQFQLSRKRRFGCAGYLILPTFCKNSPSFC